MTLRLRSFGLPMAIFRHGIILAISAGAILAQGLYLKVPVDAQFTSWVLVAIGVGVLSALLAPRLVGLVFVVAGMTVGVLALFAIQVGSTAGVQVAALTVGILYIEVIESAALAYLLTAIAIALPANRRRSRA